MSAQGSTSQSIVQEWFGAAALRNRVWIWGGTSAITLGYALTHLPGPTELLGWTALASAGLWGIQQLRQRSAHHNGQIPKSLTPEFVQRAIAQAKTKLTQLCAEAPDWPIATYETQLTEIEKSLTRQTLDLQIIGTRAVGKSTLRQLLGQQDPASFQQRWCLTPIEETMAEAISPLSSDWPEALRNADVVLFLIQGDLTQQEWKLLQHLRSQHKRILLVLNKQDQYLPTQAELVLEQLKQQVKEVIGAEDIMAIATAPQPIKVRRHQEDGSFQETWETPQPQIQSLLDRIQTIAAQESNQLVLQRAYQEVLTVQQEIQVGLNRIRRDHAMPLLERYQWIAAGIAFANPLPSLDMVATAAITGKMIQELAEVYDLRLSLDRATEIAGVLAKTLIQMGLVEASSQVLSAVLKGNAVTYVAGGGIQGVGAAYFTRMAGLSLIELFEVHRTSEGIWQLDSTALGQIVQRIFKQHQRIDILKDLAQKTLGYLQSDTNTTASLSPAGAN
jgi:uncharacterized protein